MDIKFDIDYFIDYFKKQFNFSLELLSNSENDLQKEFYLGFSRGVSSCLSFLEAFKEVSKNG